MVQIMGKTGTRGLERRREILRAASRVFREKGFHAAGMRDIAAVLGVAVGKLYYYFESKQALLAYCQEETLGGLLKMLEEVRQRDLDPAQKLYLALAGHLACLNRGLPGSLAHLEAESLEGKAREQILRLRARYEQGLVSLVEEGLRAGLFLAADPHLSVLAILGALNWTAKWYRPEGRRSLSEIQEHFAGLLLRGLLGEGVSFQAPRIQREEESHG